MSNKLVRVVASGAGLRRVNAVASSPLHQQPTWDIGGPDDRRYESVIQNSVNDPTCKSIVVGGGGSSPYVLADGTWNDSGIWVDAEPWKDVA